MAKRTLKKRVDRDKAPSHAGVAEDFLRAAEMAKGHSYCNAAALLLVHCAIAYADAVCICLAGQKFTSDTHMDAITLLKESARNRKGLPGALGHLRRIIEEKNRVAYTGEAFRERDVNSLHKHALRFREWAGALLEIDGL